MTSGSLEFTANPHLSAEQEWGGGVLLVDVCVCLFCVYLFILPANSYLLVWSCIERECPVCKDSLYKLNC